MQDLAIITGAGSGIGRALAIELATKHGLDILAIGRTLDTLLETSQADEGWIKPLQADVSTVQGRKVIIDSLKYIESVRFLVHNAAVLDPVLPLAEISLKDWRKHQQINVEGPLFLTQALLPKLSGGRILHISSGAAHNAYAGWGAYCTSKAALHMLYQVLNKELKESGIAVGSLRPGVVDTPMQNRVRQASEAEFPELVKFQKLKEENKLLDPGHVARFIANVLLNTDRKTFSKKEWDIRDS